ncbi:hypothetical protein ACFVQ0_06280 [Streptomyces sp. NPDC057900]|uniref:hypothetical protein n=1 Tax=Streptomyces sp. NPDC057900 TaxID=3346274 RepID=UPI0036EF762E
MREPHEPMTPLTRPSAGHVLVVGATRILRPAVTALAARGSAVTAVARSEDDLCRLVAETPGRVGPLVADVTAPGFGGVLHRAIGRSGLTGALVYAPSGTPAALEALTRDLVVGGPVVLVLTSRWAAPEASTEQAGRAGRWTPDSLPAPAWPAQDCRRLVLGWHRDAGGARWHTPQEISAAALGLLDAPAEQDSVLGAVRPWGERPG